MLRLLDPTVVGPDGSFSQQDVATLLIRRHRHHAEVANEVGGDWAERADPVNLLVEPSSEEDAVATELSQVWLHPTTGRSPYSGENATLFPWTLAKAFRSSPPALAESISQRRRTVLGGADTPARRAALTVEQQTELAALDTLAKLNEAAAGPTAGKFDALVKRLKQIGVGAGSDMRAVVFAERIKTLEWLTERLPAELGLADIQVRIMHGGLSDIEQQEIVDDFKQSTSKVRVLVAGYVASEGVNLHSQCHHLIHYDIPWSLIRIEQRNGRIDRYGQRFSPVMTSLALAPADSRFSGDIRVLSRLVEREHEAHGALGDVASLMGKHNVSEEESAIRKVLQGTSTLDQEIRTVEDVVAGDDLDALWRSSIPRRLVHRAADCPDRPPTDTCTRAIWRSWAKRCAPPSTTSWAGEIQPAGYRRPRTSNRRELIRWPSTRSSRSPSTGFSRSSRAERSRYRNCNVHSSGTRPRCGIYSIRSTRAIRSGT